MKVCVIGSGPSGLTTIKQLLDEGHDVTCFEKNDRIGGIWNRSGDDGDQMKVFDNLVLTISAKLMAYSDFMVEKKRVFYTHEQYLRYLQAYTDEFDLQKHIVFDATVSAVRKNSNGTWSVVVATSDGRRTEHTFEAVAACTGPFKTPNMNVTDIDEFEGEVIHSYKYRNSQGFRDKRVLVVGLAESGADIVREISEVASECTLAIRSYAYLLPRLFHGTVSTDAATGRSHHYEEYLRATTVPFPMKGLFGNDLPTRVLFMAFAGVYGLAAAVSGTVSRLFRRNDGRDDDGGGEPRNNLGQPMYPKKIDIDTEWTEEHVNAIHEWNRRSHKYMGNWTLKAIFSKNVSFIPNIVSGKIAVNDAGIERIEGKRVYFEDGASSEVDAIVLCTGFVQDFSMLDAEARPRDDNVRNLYRHALHPDHDGRLAFIGFVRPFGGGIPVCAEMQARYFALMCSGKLRLPDDLAGIIQREKEWEETFTAMSPRHTDAVPSLPLFLDPIAKDIGCLLSPWELILDPRLFVRHWFYPFNQSCYRLKGPHSMHESALEQIMEEEPGLLGVPRVILAGVALSVLPYFIHPKDLIIKNPKPPKGTHPAKEAHFLRPRRPDGVS